MADWERAIQDFAVFPDGVCEVDPESDEFKRRTERYQGETLLWANDKFDLVAVDRPHLNGIHLVVHPNPEYWVDRGGFLKPWHLEKIRKGERPGLEHQQAFVESVAIARTAEQLVMASSLGQTHEHPELHSSGNWAPDLKFETKGGKLDPDSYQAADLPAERTVLLHHLKPKTAYHMHIYIPKRGYVALPSRPQAEAPDEWAHLESNVEPGEDGSPRHTRRYRELLDQLTGAVGHGRLSSELEQSARGPLFS